MIEQASNMGSVNSLVVHPQKPFDGDVVTIIGKTTYCGTLVVTIKGHNGANIPFEIQCIDGVFNILFKCPDYNVPNYQIMVTFKQPDQSISTKTIPVRKRN